MPSVPVRPSRSSVKRTLLPLRPPTSVAISLSDMPETSRPSTAVMTSPFCTPASAAGPPSTTPRTTAPRGSTFISTPTPVMFSSRPAVRPSTLAVCVTAGTSLIAV